jgi:DNA integrity scanning protein DisA with diadenylate cyclase activity
MDEELLSFTKVQPDGDLINEIWSFNVKNLHAISDPVLSQYVIALSQWLVYFKAQTNETRAQISQLSSDIEFLVATWMKPEILKEHKTQTAARDYLIRNNSGSAIMFEKMQKLKHELIKVDGIDKAVTELISAFKRELTRRDNELYTIRKERR